MSIRQLLIASAAFVPACLHAQSIEFCLDGKFDLGARYQGMHQQSGEFSPARWCVVSEDDSERVVFSARGRSNPDMQSSWVVAVLPPDVVRIVNRNAPPDVEFHGENSRDEARRIRRIDPRRLIDELATRPVSTDDEFEAVVDDGKLVSVAAFADLPLRGRVPVSWRWEWQDPASPSLEIRIDDDVVFRARGSWRQLGDDEATEVWQRSPGAEPIEVPGEQWPARVNMRRIELADGVHLVRGVRTGFQHLVVQTKQGLVVADAPAGWVELHQIPPTDLVPGLGISGLSERFIDFLAEEFPGEAVRAVGLTHAHDDHAGGARAFAAAGAEIYAPAAAADFLASALNRETMPADRLGAGQVRVKAVGDDPVVLDDEQRPVVLLRIGASPHVDDSLGVLADQQGFFFVSDLHVPRSDADTPRPERAVTECWFAGWAVSNLPPGTVVINTHSAEQTPVERLARYLDSDVC